MGISKERGLNMLSKKTMSIIYLCIIIFAVSLILALSFMVINRFIWAQVALLLSACVAAIIIIIIAFVEIINTWREVEENENQRGRS